MREFHFAHPTTPSKDSRHEILFIDLEPYRRAMAPEQFSVFENRYNEALALYRTIQESTQHFVIPATVEQESPMRPHGMDTITDLDDTGKPVSIGSVPAIIPTPELTEAQKQQWQMYSSIVKTIDTALAQAGKQQEPWDFAYDIGYMALKDAARRFLTEHDGLTDEQWRWVDRALGPIFTSASAIVGSLHKYRAVREGVQQECMAQLNATEPNRAEELERGIQRVANTVALMEKIMGYNRLEKEGVVRSDAMSNVARSWQDPKKASPLGLTTFEQAMEREFAGIDTVKGRF